MIKMKRMEVRRGRKTEKYCGDSIVAKEDDVLSLLAQNGRWL